MNKEDLFFEIYSKYFKNKFPFIIVTLVQVNGSAPQDVGAKMLVSNNGLEVGTIGGGKIESYALSECQNYFKKNILQTTLNDINLQKDIGMSCGGIVKLLFEPFNINLWEIIIFGAGHISQALSKILITLKCKITVIDPREDWLTKLPSSPRLVKHSNNFNFNSLKENSFLLIMTKGHTTDLPILKEIAKLDKKFPYLGVIGSQTKAIRLKQELAKMDISSLFLEKIICPIGEKIGSNSPEEISISITAQLLKVRDLTNH